MLPKIHTLPKRKKKNAKSKTSKTSTGVADYFAILGIESFLPPDDEDEEKEEGEDEEDDLHGGDGGMGGMSGMADVGMDDVGNHHVHVDDGAGSNSERVVERDAGYAENAGEGVEAGDTSNTSNTSNTFHSSPVNANNTANNSQNHPMGNVATPRNNNLSRKLSTATSLTTTTDSTVNVANTVSASRSCPDPPAEDELRLNSSAIGEEHENAVEERNEEDSMGDETKPMEEQSKRQKDPSDNETMEETKELDEEMRMRQERFQREIVQMALLSNETTHDLLNSSLDHWTIVKENDETQKESGPMSLPCFYGKDSSSNAVTPSNVPVHFAFRRRGCLKARSKKLTHLSSEAPAENADMDPHEETPTEESSMNQQQTRALNEDTISDSNSPHIDSNDRNQMDYYSPAIADISLHYAKVHLQSLPPWHDTMCNHPPNPLFDNGSQYHSSQHSTNPPDNPPDNPPSNPPTSTNPPTPTKPQRLPQLPKSIAHSAKHLSSQLSSQPFSQLSSQLSTSLTKRNLGGLVEMAAAGKEMAVGLAHAVGAVGAARGGQKGVGDLTELSGGQGGEGGEGRQGRQGGEGGEVRQGWQGGQGGVMHSDSLQISVPSNPKEQMEKGQSQPHLYDTGKEGGSFETDLEGTDVVTNFEDAHGEVPLWKEGKSPSTPHSSTSRGGTGATGATGGRTVGAVERSGRGRRRREHFFPDTPLPQCSDDGNFGYPEEDGECDEDENDVETREHGANDGNGGMHPLLIPKPLSELLPLPKGYQEWVIPNNFETLHLPTPEYFQSREELEKEEKRRLGEQQQHVQNSHHLHHPQEINRQHSQLSQLSQHSQHSQNSQQYSTRHRPPILVDRTHALPSPLSRTTTPNAQHALYAQSAQSPYSTFHGRSSPSSMGVEAMYLSPCASNASSQPQQPQGAKFHPTTQQQQPSDVQHPQEQLQDLQHVQRVDNPSLEPDPRFLPKLISLRSLPPRSSNLLASQSKLSNPKNDHSEMQDRDTHDVIYIPILAIRRQRTGEAERFREDPAVVDVHILLDNDDGASKRFAMQEEEEDDEGDVRGSASLMLWGVHPDILKTSRWISTISNGSDRSNAKSNTRNRSNHHSNEEDKIPFNTKHLPQIHLKHNIPQGLCDLPFPTKVLDRFPLQNYRGMPFPEEELPLFCCYGANSGGSAGGSVLVRDTLRNVPMGKCFGFVVKNERGDSIYVSCLSFLEPLTKRRQKQLDRISKKRRHVSLPHRFYYEKQLQERQRQNSPHSNFNINFAPHLLSFDEPLPLERKTICLLSRYPYWTEYRRFLTHLHLLTSSSTYSTDLPIERHISHLLLSVPIPKPGGQCVLVPLSTMAVPLALFLPPLKDLPLVDLGYARLFSALDVPTVVTIVLGFLCLERKVILMSTRQSLVLDCSELLKSLLFPFDVCAPYVPHLTEPFMSCLEFPGAIFVGIHDDGHVGGLAQRVRKNIPEDSIIVDLDLGEIHCDGNRYETLKSAYQIIPAEPRTGLIKEIEALCQDAGIIPGQEPLDYGIDSAIDSPVPSTVADNLGKYSESEREPLDDRGIRDAFLRFFCSIFGGYERFLVVPDADFLISGNDWFDSSKFLATASHESTPFLNSLVHTQCFQSFIQRRTEASDVHCMLFDECLAEYHSSTVKYGRLGGDVERRVHQDGRSEMIYILLVDQCATEPDVLLDDDESASFLARSEVNDKGYINENDAATQASSGCGESSIASDNDATSDVDVPFALNSSGDIVTIPSTANLPPNPRYMYRIDGNPCFPTSFHRNLFHPKEPQSLSTESSEVPPPILTRSEKERDDSIRLCNMAASKKGPQKQRRCFWQLPKFMGSQFLGAWLMCIPNQISQSNPVEKKSKILLRALGALRTLRSHRRIIADEAAYRALIVACGRCGTDRRVELMKLYGLMRNDGIFPNAVTLGQYTRSIAEGFSKRSVDSGDDGRSKVGMEVVLSAEKKGESRVVNLDVLDSNLSLMEESGLKWRSGGAHTVQVEPIMPLASSADHGVMSDNSFIAQTKTFDTTATTHKSTKMKRMWHPVNCSSSFCSDILINPNDKAQSGTSEHFNATRLVALWSRTASCDSCSYVPLDEEIQCGWDVMHASLDMGPSISCPRCGSSLLPLLGYHEMLIHEALGMDEVSEYSNFVSELNTSGGSSSISTQISFRNENALEGIAGEKKGQKSEQNYQSNSSHPSDELNEIRDASLNDLPPQLDYNIQGESSSSLMNENGLSGFVTYLSPLKLRLQMEQLVLEFGEEVLDRNRLRALDPEVFFNLWWYCARFSLPLPLAVSSALDTPKSSHTSVENSNNKAPIKSNWCALASWDRTVAVQGCRSAAKAMLTATNLNFNSERSLREKLFDNPNADTPLLSFFNLQNYAQGDWDHDDLSEILVSLVKACDSRDFLPVLECALHRNCIRREEKEQSEVRNPQVNNCRGSGFGNLNSSFESAGTVSYSIGASTDASFNPTSVELDCYRTLLYLARYQCTTAFHAFFPSTVKACKGYHFWCAQGTPLPIFDRAFREAAEECGKKKKMIVPIADVSDVALGFRCVFGHII